MFSFPILYLRNDDLKAYEIMTDIMQRLRERELQQAKETVGVYKYIV